jgi:hypothetical protein
MAHEGVEVRNEAVRGFISAFENDTDAFRNTLHPAIEWFPLEENRTPRRGIEAAMSNRSAWLDTWDEHRLELRGDRVLERDVATLLVESVVTAWSSAAEFPPQERERIQR